MFAHSSKTFAVTVTSSVPSTKQYSRCSRLRMLAASTRTWPSPLQEHLFNVLNNIHPVLAYVVQTLNKRRNVGRMLCALRRCVHCGCLLLRKAKGHIDPHALSTDICAARRPSAVHGYLMYALAIHENISRPWSNISCALVLSSEKTSIDTPASPTIGTIVCTISCIRAFLPDLKVCAPMRLAP